MADPFEVLDLPRHAGEGEIRKRYLELVRAFPPERRRSGLQRCTPPIRRFATRPRVWTRSSSASSAQNDSLEALAADLRAAAASACGFRSKPCCHWQTLHERSSRCRRYHRPLSRVARLRARRGRRPRRTSSRARAIESDVGREFGIIDLVEEFTALRHEVKLQTKSSRGLSEQTETTLEALKHAIEQFQSVVPREAQAVWTAGKVLAEGLADLDEALDRGEREIERAREQIAERSPRRSKPLSNELHRSQSWIRRRLLRSYHNEIIAIVQRDSVNRHELFDSFLEGYGLIQKRLRRVMAAEQVQRIPCEGLPVDPELMTVLEVDRRAGRSPRERSSKSSGAAIPGEAV